MGEEKTEYPELTLCDKKPPLMKKKLNYLNSF